MKGYKMRLVWSLIGLIAIGIIVAFIYASSLIKTAVETVGSRTLGVPVTLGMAKIEPLSGHLSLSDFEIRNPKGYTTQTAFSVKKIDIKVKLSSILNETVVIENIRIERPETTFEGVYDQNNIKDLYKALSSAEHAEHTQETHTEPHQTSHEDHTHHAHNHTPKIIIDSFEFIEGKVRAVIKTPVGQKDQSAQLPNLTLTHIGRHEGGLSLTEAALEISAPIQEEIQKLAHGIMGDLKGELQNGVDTFKSRVKSLADDVKKLF